MQWNENKWRDLLFLKVELFHLTAFLECLVQDAAEDPRCKHNGQTSLSSPSFGACCEFTAKKTVYFT